MSYAQITQQLQTTAFGDLDVAQPTPTIQLQFAYNVNAYETSNIVVSSGTVTSSPPFAVVQSGAATNSSASLRSRGSNPYRTGQGGLVLFTAIYTTGVAGNVQLVGCGGTTTGLFFGYNGTVFGINRRSNGSDNWIAQTNWNIDPVNGSGPSGMNLNPTLGNVYKIQYQWLGFGNINFFVENPATGIFTKVHMIQYPNSATVTSLGQPSMPLYVSSANTSNSTNVTVQTPSMAAFTEGLTNDIGNLFSTNATRSITTTELPIFSIQNNTTFNGVVNFKTIQLLNLSIYNAAAAASQVTFYIRWNPTLTGAAFTNLSSTQSCVSVDTTASAISGTASGLLASFYLIGSQFNQVDLSFLHITFNPGDILSVSAVSTGAGANHSASLSWSESY